MESSFFLKTRPTDLCKGGAHISACYCFQESALDQRKLTCKHDPAMVYFLPGWALMKTTVLESLHVYTLIFQVGYPQPYLHDRYSSKSLN